MVQSVFRINGLKINIVFSIMLIFITYFIFFITSSVFVFDKSIFYLIFIFALFSLFFSFIPRYRSKRMEILVEGLLFVILGGWLAGITAVAALRMGAPYADIYLDRWDIVLGIHTEKIFFVFSQWDMVNRILAFVYQKTVPAIFFSVAVISLTGDSRSLYQMVFVFSCSAMICSISNLFFPALGTVIYHHLSHNIMKHFPDGSGTYFLNSINIYHSRLRNTVSISDLNGVVEFPSFHAVMALIEFWFLRKITVLNFFSSLFSGMVIFSCIVIGGHYVVDIVGGLVVFLIVLFVANIFI